MLMSIESWARRASGLLVPTIGFADHPLGRWQPCVGPCCEGGPCIVCGHPENPDTGPAQLEIELSGFSSTGDAKCPDCDALNDTFVLTESGNHDCVWNYQDDNFFCSGGILEISLSLYYGELNVQVGFRAGTSPWEQMNLHYLLLVPPLNCAEWADLEIPYSDGSADYPPPCATSLDPVKITAI